MVRDNIYIDIYIYVIKSDALDKPKKMRADRSSRLISSILENLAYGIKTVSKTCNVCIFNSAVDTMQNHWRSVFGI